MKNRIDISVSLLIVDWLQLLLGAQSMFGISPTQNLTLLRLWLAILVLSTLLYSSPFPLSSQDPLIDQSSSGRLVHKQKNLVEASLKSTFSTSAIIRSITLHAKDGITITSNSDGVVRTWDISTGLCKASFQTPAKGINRRDVQLINSRLVLVWHADKMIEVWDVEKDKLLLKADGPNLLEDLKISEDGSRVFALGRRAIQAQSMQTGKVVGKVGIKAIQHSTGSITVDGSKVWVHNSSVEDQIWDFGTPGSSPVQLPTIPLVRSHSNWHCGVGH